MDRSIRTRVIDATQCIFFTEFGFREESSPLDGGDYCDFDNIADASVLSSFLGVSHSKTISLLKSRVVNPNNSASNNSVSFVRMNGGYFDDECQDGSLGTNDKFD